jgi:hypothetical protein
MPINPKLGEDRWNDFSLTDDSGITYDFKLDQSLASLNENPSVPSSLLQNSQGGKYGDWDPGHAHTEIRTAEGGRGQDALEDITKFSDSMAYTLTPGVVHNPLLRRFATGLRSVDENMPEHDFYWFPLYGDNLLLDTPFAASASYNADKCYLYIRRVGNPGSLTLSLCPDSSGVPGSATKSIAITIDDVSGYLAKFQKFDWATTTALTATTTYHLKVAAGATYSEVNHWEIGCERTSDLLTQPTMVSSAGSAWSNTSLRMFYRITDADVDRAFHLINFKGALYAISQYADGTTSVMYMQGDRGNADSNAAAKTTLIDASKSGTWTTDCWKGWRVKVVGGPGIGEHKLITSNTTTVLTCDSPWQTTHTTASEYVIYGGSKFSVITVGTTAIAGVVSDVTMMKSQMILAQGDAQHILKVSQADNTHTGASDGSNHADYVHAYYDPDDGAVCWRAVNSAGQVSKATATAVGADMTFGTGFSVGDSTYAVTRLWDYDDKPYVFKEDSVWSVKGSKPAKVNIGLEAIPSLKTGKAVISKNLYLIFNWSHSLERLYGSMADDFGPWKGAGMPSSRRGFVSCAEGPIGWIFVGINAGSGTSSVLAWNDRGWHELFRGFEAGKKIEALKWQPVEGGNPVLWINYGGELCYLEFPANDLNPLRDESLSFEPEGYLEQSSIDLALSQLPKYFKDVDIITENLGGGDFISLDYQLDGEIGTDFWHRTEDVYRSPVDKVEVNEGNVRKIKYRYRIYANDLHRPPVVSGFVAKMFARTPSSRIWTVRVRTDGIKRNGDEMKPSDVAALYVWLWTSSASANGLLLHSFIPEMDNIHVIVEPPGMTRTSIDSDSMDFSRGVIHMTLREI